VHKLISYPVLVAVLLYRLVYVWISKLSNSKLGCVKGKTVQISDKCTY